ncbi:unnamed protein product [Rhizophagus irregularis]|nr:unnamed protein product [Rhizophagus irregularis]CAB4447001.1 unnamed protein product [Rhizophagus irregularis]
MQKCWHSDPNERPSASDVLKEFNYPNNLDKRKFNNNLIENNNNNKDKIHKRLKYCEEQNDDYLTQELEFDINCNTNSNKSEDNDYITSELNFDI